MLPFRRRPGVGGVLILAALILSPAGASSASETTPRLGAHAMIDTSMSPETVDALFAATRSAHLGSVRFDVLAAWLFPDSEREPEWQTLDLYRAAASRHGLQAVGVLYGVPLWLARCPPGARDFFRCPPSDYAAWGRMVHQIAARAPEIRFWEVVNEANLPNTYFYGDAYEYARFLRVTSAAIRAGNPRAKVVFTGVLAPYSEWLDKVLAQPGVIGSFDIANAHLRGGVDKLDEMVSMARGKFAFHGFHGPFWVTEMGYTSDPRRQWIPGYLGTDFATGRSTQARYMRRTIPALLRSGARRVFVTLRDLDTEWGIFTSEGVLHWPMAVPKPAYRVVTRIAERLVIRAERRRRGLRGSGRARARRRPARAPRRGSAQQAAVASLASR